MAKAADTKTAAARPRRRPRATRTAAETEKIRAALAERRDELRAEYDQTLTEITELQRDRLTDSAGDDQADTGTKTFEREQEISLANNILERITQVERALDRLDEGSYGWCERCGNADPGRAAGRVPVGYPLRDLQAAGGAALTVDGSGSTDGAAAGRGAGRRGSPPCRGTARSLTAVLVVGARPVDQAARPSTHLTDGRAGPAARRRCLPRPAPATAAPRSASAPTTPGSSRSSRWS